MTDLDKFYQFCKVSFAGDPDEVTRLTGFLDPNKLEKILRGTLDKIFDETYADEVKPEKT
jgi:hypothetical protein